MSLRLVRPGRPGEVDRVLRSLDGTALTYGTRGASLSDQVPEGFSSLGGTTVLGHGSEAFQRASDGLRQWRAHRLPGLTVLPAGAPLEEGISVVVALGTRLLAVGAPCRIVAVVEEPGRFGFAYGTLPGHPEEGEEAFMVSIDDDRVVRFDITAFSRPAGRLMKAVGPLGRGVQSVATAGYLRAMRRFVGG